ncbi:Chs7p [Sugiyamaella lignohabitans]|uniref:Chitin synthase export chaperone n=1 Tax=Sugiyamaella lignohabitans TaxID=796027 RepID=A0A167DC11_9ASCO|nr:Chs7p [Sugiyamaella lignohabitans]ANB12741.1 Chs7p [Sugiyamaella lignohabitans]
MGFGDFDILCHRTYLPLCSLVGPYNHEGLSAAETTLFPTGIIPGCFARTIVLANTIIFNVGNAFMHIGAIGVLVLIIFNVRSKYTAIGRVEILHFFYIFTALTMISLVIDAGVTPPGSPSYPYFVSIQSGLTSALCCCLMLNGFLGFQLYEDDTFWSKWSLRVMSFLAFALTFVVSLLTFQGWGGDSMSPTNTTGLFVVLYILNAIFLAVYFASQLTLSAIILQDLWAVGAVFLGGFFFVVGQVLLYVFAETICLRVKHYIDGVFFATVCNLFAVMMVYKYWDMITSEDMEFGVSNREAHWEVKELMEDDQRYDNGSEYASSTYGLTHFQ